MYWAFSICSYEVSSAFGRHWVLSNDIKIMREFTSFQEILSHWQDKAISIQAVMDSRKNPFPLSIFFFFFWYFYSWNGLQKLPVLCKHPVESWVPASKISLSAVRHNVSTKAESNSEKLKSKKLWKPVCDRFKLFTTMYFYNIEQLWASQRDVAYSFVWRHTGVSSLLPG